MRTAGTVLRALPPLGPLFVHPRAQGEGGGGAGATRLSAAARAWPGRLRAGAKGCLVIEN